MSERFYINCPLALGPVELEGQEAHHLATVSRLGPGDPVCLFNGDGQEYAGLVVSAARKSVALEVQEVRTPSRELDFRLEIAAPLPKGDRATFLIEKLTELGVTRFTPLQTQRSVVHPGESKLEKLERHVIEASKQCGRNRLMQIGPLTPWPFFHSLLGLPTLRSVAHLSEPTETSSTISAAGGDQDAVFAVGPEGGFTEEEIAAARKAGWQTILLGPRTLRIETAAVVLAARAAIFWPRTRYQGGTANAANNPSGPAI